MTDATIELFGRASSSNVQAVLWALEELGLTYIRQECGGRFGGLDTDAFLRMNPHGRIPVLRVRDGVIWESAAILRYLAGVHGTDPFWPSDPMARARVDMWAEWAKLSVATAFTVPVFWEAVRTRPDRRDPETIARNVTTFETELAKAEPMLARQAYLCGDDMTLADVAFAHVLYRYYDAGLAQADLPNVRAYYRRLAARPAYRQAVMTSYDELRDTL